MVEAEVEFDYEAVNLDELTLTKGDVIKNIKMMEGGWWEGEVGGKRGMFPDNFVKRCGVHCELFPPECDVQGEVICQGLWRPSFRHSYITKWGILSSNSNHFGPQQSQSCSKILDSCHCLYYPALLRVHCACTTVGGEGKKRRDNFGRNSKSTIIYFLCDPSGGVLLLLYFLSFFFLFFHQTLCLILLFSLVTCSCAFNVGLRQVIKDKEKEKGSSMKSKTQAPLANGDAAASSGMNTPDQDSKVTKREGGSKKRLMRAKVAYSYNPQNDDELELVVNETVEVLNQPEEGWWEGIINGKQGMFPSNFVNIIKDDEVHESRPEASGPSAAAGAATTPAEEERPPKSKIKSSGMGFGNIFQSGQPHLRKTPAPSKDVGTPKSEPFPFALKRMSLRKDQASADKNAAEEKRKAEESEKEKAKSEKDHTDHSAKGICRVRVIFDYDPKNNDELQLRKGDIVVVLDKDAGDSGWWRGELNGKEGVFPDNFTEEIPPEDKSKKKTPAPGPARPTSGPVRPLSGEQPPLLPRPTRPMSGDQKGAVPPKSSIAKQSSQDGPKAAGKESSTNGQQRHVPAGARQVLPPPSKRPPLLSKPSAAKVHNKSADSLDTSKDSTEAGKADAKEATFDDIKPSSEKLTHLNLSRPKAVGNRRPPSTVGGPGVQPASNSVDSAPPSDTPPILPRSKHKKLLQNHTPLASIPAQTDSPLKTHDVTPPSKSPTQTHPPVTIPHSKPQPPDHPPPRHSDHAPSSSSISASKEPAPSNEPPWKTELKNRNQKANVSHAGGLQSVENGSAPPGRPKTTPMPSVAASSTTSVASKPDTSGAPPRPAPISTADPTAVAAAATGVASLAEARPSGDSAGTAELVQDLKKEIKGLHDMIAAMKSEFKKEVKKLMTEVDEEKKHRMMMQVELERIKKLVMEGD
ncbi:SH3 domain-containing kinase-binding protein 1-like [Diadema antillarum]|uniref:SH3 domain-containing kinase-binding protein 1-like n=1 Tax=Diadema antillarum TaxID=105358 RepID=UPI003A86B517